MAVVVLPAFAIREREVQLVRVLGDIDVYAPPVLLPIPPQRCPRHADRVDVLPAIESEPDTR